VIFFFSSRRRHTRFSRDWSSDVCSSDLYTSNSIHPFANRRVRDPYARWCERRTPFLFRGGAVYSITTRFLFSWYYFLSVFIQIKIGRASCRERVYSQVLTESVKKIRRVS